LFIAAAGCAAPAVQSVDLASPPAPKAFHSHGIWFTYPGDWISFEAEVPDPSQGIAPTSKDILGLDDLNVVSVTSQPAPSFNREASLWDRKVRSRLSKAFVASGIKVTSGPEKVMLAGEKGLRWVIRQPSGVGYVLVSTIVVMISEDTEYDVKCQHTLARALEIDRGCEQLLSTFELRPTEA
jgi:hypothetical protein